ncbi:hypothetical protein LSH36_1076g00017 [Paralvinella palmiformis]|uniref:C-type lectin domain-containing protein n=1 Tax=Paralvinella palmiformis TaxID=53620 RepID=A0AAD9IVY4_9ANNE|nr:hypothetical protein LSH36_1076g00017 [Paralvinella palmiformis]
MLKLNQDKIELIVFSSQQHVKKGCDSGWQPFGNYCYILLVSESSPYDDVLDARRACLRHGTDLAFIRSEDEQRFIITLFPGTSVTEIYLATSDAIEEDHFIHFDGTALDFTNWGDSEPNNYPTFGGENCVAIIYSCDGRAVGDWIDVPCLFNPRLINGAICKKPVDEPPTDSSSDSFQDKFHMVKESYMMNNAIFSINVPTYVDCMRLCSEDTTCLSVNYNRRRLTDYNCVLNSQSRLVSRNLTSDSGVAGFSLGEWTYYEQRYRGY